MRMSSRKIGTFGAAAAVIAAAMALVWFVVVPQQRPGLVTDEGYGIDVSNHQGSVDWARVAADSVQFAYVKAT